MSHASFEQMNMTHHYLNNGFCNATGGHWFQHWCRTEVEMISPLDKGTNRNERLTPSSATKVNGAFSGAETKSCDRC